MPRSSTPSFQMPTRHLPGCGRAGNLQTVQHPTWRKLLLPGGLGGLHPLPGWIGRTSWREVLDGDLVGGRGLLRSVYRWLPLLRRLEHADASTLPLSRGALLLPHGFGCQRCALCSWKLQPRARSIPGLELPPLPGWSLLPSRVLDAADLHLGGGVPGFQPQQPRVALPGRHLPPNERRPRHRRVLGLP